MIRGDDGIQLPFRKSVLNGVEFLRLCSGQRVSYGWAELPPEGELCEEAARGLPEREMGSDLLVKRSTQRDAGNAKGPGP